MVCVYLYRPCGTRDMPRIDTVTKLQICVIARGVAKEAHYGRMHVP
jgi:hypothetical protein